MKLKLSAVLKRTTVRFPTTLLKIKKAFIPINLKAAKVCKVVIKGIDSSVKSREVNCIKSVTNNKRNKNKQLQPVCRVEFEHDTRKLKKSETHSIHGMKYLLHRRITAQEPHMRNGLLVVHELSRIRPYKVVLQTALSLCCIWRPTVIFTVRIS